MLFYRLESLNFLIRQLANSPIRQLSRYLVSRYLFVPISIFTNSHISKLPRILIFAEIIGK